jgi:hypothetical protein
MGNMDIFKMKSTPVKHQCAHCAVLLLAVLFHGHRKEEAAIDFLNDYEAQIYTDTLNQLAEVFGYIPLYRGW